MAKKGNKNSAKAGQRGKKKHAKELKRKHKLANPNGRREARARNWHPVKEGIEGLSLSVGDHYYKVTHELDDYTALPLDELPSVVWTKPRIAALTTDELLERLGSLGIATTEDAFLAAIQQESSAIRFAEKAWLPLLPKGSSVHDRDLARLAACALWQRLRPAEHSMEGILDPYLAGVDHTLAHDTEAALEEWLVFFDRLRPRLTPAVRTIEALTTLLEDAVEDVEEWIQDLCIFADLLPASATDLTRRVAAVIGAIEAQLTGEGEEWRLCLVENQAHLLAKIGARAEGEEVLRARIARTPTMLAPYLALTDFINEVGRKDPTRIASALAVLKEAKANMARPVDRHNLEEVITEITERLGEAGAEPASTREGAGS